MNAMPEFSACEETGGPTYALLLYSLAESAKASRILEIGAGWGHSGRAFSESLCRSLPSTLISVDPYPARIKKENYEAITASGIDWRVVTGRSESVKVEGDFDIIYIDGDPKNARADFDKFYPQLREGGYMVLDGYGGQSYPTAAVDALAATHPFTMLPYSPAYALAVHRKPLPPVTAGKYLAKCESCNESCFRSAWTLVDDWCDEHVRTTQHTVSVIAQPRSLKYRKGPR